MTIQIRKIEIDHLTDGSFAEGKVPSWSKVRASVNGVDVQLSLTEEQTQRMIASAEPIVRELLENMREWGKAGVDAPKGAVVTIPLRDINNFSKEAPLSASGGE